MGCEGEISVASHYALVAYIPGRLAEFLDNLRCELKPGCVLKAHVTILPPRPVDLNIGETVRQISLESHESPPFMVELGDVAVFEKSSVIYLSLSRGERELHALNENLNAGQLEYDGPFPYHPHITLAQDLAPERVQRAVEIARMRWAAYRGPRQFPVEELAFVRREKSGCWRDLAWIDMAQPLSAAS